ncbi:MAG: hypothetical protein R6X31_06680 [Anaerolineae bacterium]
MNTLWRAGVDAGPIQLHALGFDVGFDKNAELFTKNNRIKKVPAAAIERTR